MTSTSSGLTMLTSGVSQYLHPDYLQPLPTTLDAKKSPLALLAQTCSAIGKDTSPSKPIIPPLEKKDCDKPDKSSDSELVSKRPNSRGNKDSARDSNKPGFRTFPPKEIPPPLVPISASASEKSMRTSSAEPKPSTSPGGPICVGMLNSSSSSSRPVSAGGHVNSAQRSSSRSSNGKEEMNRGDHHQHNSSGSSSSNSGSSSHHITHHRQRDSPASSGSSSSSSSSSHHSTSSPSYSKPSSSHSSSVMQTSSSLSSAMKPSTAHPSILSGLPSAAAAAAAAAAHLAGYPNPLALMGHGLDPTSSSYHSALAAHSSLSSFSAAAAAAAAAQSTALKTAAAGSAAALSPFVTYARVRTPSGATTLVPVCRDPYCTNCQLTLQNSHLSSTCNAPGCAQCAHEKSLTSLSTLGLPATGASSMLLPSLSSAGSLSSSMSALSSLHSLYPHSALAAAHQGLPYVCNWVSGNDYCGKRFTSSEELLQHLRTHTSSMDVSTLAASYAGLGLPSALAAYPHLSAAPLSPNSLRRTYPTSLSPVSSLLGASRYHPYKSPLSGVGAAPPAPQSFAPVGPYYSPYTLYGQRLGAAVVP